MSDGEHHDSGKKQIVKWLKRMRLGARVEVHDEYPIGIKGNKLFGFDGWPGGIPSFKDMPRLYGGMVTYVRFDVAVLQFGRLLAAYETINTHGITPDKRERLKRIEAETGAKVFELSNNWIITRPFPDERIPDDLPLPDCGVDEDALKDFLDRLLYVETSFAEHRIEYTDSREDMRAEIESNAGLGFGFDVVEQLVRREQEGLDAIDAEAEANATKMLLEICHAP